MNYHALIDLEVKLAMLRPESTFDIQLRDLIDEIIQELKRTALDYPEGTKRR